MQLERAYGVNAPKITVVTPCFNHAAFLRDTIESVLGQNYPNLEYIVMDGGSTDGSVEIIQHYANQLAYWQSARDNGMYAAINLGMARASGDILAWLNADDYYLVGALNFAAANLNVEKPELLFGNAFHFVQNSAEQWGSDVQGEHARQDLYKYDYIIQPASFWTRQAWTKTGPLDESLDIVADWEWFARAKSRGVTLKPDSRYLAAYRILRTSKTQQGGQARNREMTEILRRNVGDEYAETFERVIADRDRILGVRRFTRRWHLARIQGPVFRALFPQIFSKTSVADVWNMLEMIGYA